MPTLETILAELVQRPGLHVKAFTTGVQTDATGAYAGVVAGADAKRQLASTDLASLNVAGDGSDDDISWYEGGFAWIKASGTLPDVEREVALDGYAPAEAASTATDQAASTEKVGVLTLTRTMGAVIAAGRSGEIHAPLPPLTDADRKVSLRSWINRALEAMRMRVTVAIVATDSDQRYSLAAETYLRDEDDLIDVRDRETLTDVESERLPGEHYLRWDGAVPYLVLGTVPLEGATFYADFWRRRKTYIAVTAKGTSAITGDAVTAVTVTRGGTYTTAPTATFSGGGGTGATGTAVLTNGTVTSVTITAGGSGYTSAPTVTFSAGVFATSSVGLVNSDDVCTGAVSDIADVAEALICDDFSLRHGQGTDSQWANRRALLEERVRPYLQWQQARPRRPKVVSIGLVRAGSLASTRRRWS